MIGIYKITNRINNKIYIGQSINIKKRWKEHIYKSNLSKDISYNSILHSSMRKNGIDNFIFEILKECSYEELDNLETYYISLYNSKYPNGYNIALGGQKVKRKSSTFECAQCGVEIWKGAKICRNCMKKPMLEKFNSISGLKIGLLATTMSMTKIAKTLDISPTTLNRWCIKKNIPNKRKELISWYNKTMGIETAEKENTKKLVKAVYQLDIYSSKIINKFNSIKEAGEYLGLKRYNHISSACKNNINYAYGFKWKYAY